MSSTTTENVKVTESEEYKKLKDELEQTERLLQFATMRLTKCQKQNQTLQRPVVESTGELSQTNRLKELQTKYMTSFMKCKDLELKNEELKDRLCISESKFVEMQKVYRRMNNENKQDKESTEIMSETQKAALFVQKNAQPSDRTLDILEKAFKVKRESTVVQKIPENEFLDMAIDKATTVIREMMAQSAEISEERKAKKELEEEVKRLNEELKEMKRAERVARIQMIHLMEANNQMTEQLKEKKTKKVSKKEEKKMNKTKGSKEVSKKKEESVLIKKEEESMNDSDDTGSSFDIVEQEDEEEI
uniref:Glutamic acid-rich protein n=1 Tax=Caenorhabditis tropicalis TaxID=1561998 RepID=A0A1I7UH20_9PELO